MGLRITIAGRVHNVGYRLLLLELADQLFIQKFDARNVRINGKEAIVVLVDGSDEQLKEFVESVKTEKPELAVVEDIKIEKYGGRIRDVESFRASFNTSQLGKIVQVGLRMLEKQDKMLEKQDMMLERQDEMLNKQDKTIDVIRDESERTRVELAGVIKSESENTRKEIVGVIREESEKTRVVIGSKIDNVAAKFDKTNDLLERRFQKLEEEIEKIKKALIKAGIEI